MGFFDDLKARISGENRYDKYDDYDDYDDYEEGYDGYEEFDRSSEHDNGLERRYTDSYQANVGEPGSVTVISRKPQARSSQSSSSAFSSSYVRDGISEAEKSFSSIRRGPVPAARREEESVGEVQVINRHNYSSFDEKPFEPSDYYIDEPKRASDLYTASPKSYDQTQDIISQLKVGSIVALSLNSCKVDVAKRILDFAFGAAFALDAHVERLDNKVFVFVPRGASLSTQHMQELKKKNFTK